MKKQTFMYFAFLSLILFSCKSNELTREKAKEIIITKNNFPSFQKKEFQTSSYHISVNRDVPTFEKLQQAGLITYNLDDLYLTAEFTEKGKEFVVSQERKGYYVDKFVDVKVAILSFGEVTGIQKMSEKNIAEVSYTVNRTCTPFGQYLFNYSDGVVTQKAIFKQYDDGWRMEANNNN